ncbi:MAG: MoxR family ATPase, partial [Pirellulaceae bacterium]
AGITHVLDRMFFVLATQNPLEMEGTYPLPEAQLDRFLFKLIVPFPSTSEMETILDRTTESYTPEAERLFDPKRVLKMTDLSRHIPISDEVRRYAIQVVMATHPDHELATGMTKQFVRYGSSPRGAQAVILAAKISAILDNRYHVAREDIKAVALNCLRHRILLNFEGQAEDIKPDAVIEDILSNTRLGQLAGV